MPSPAYAEVVLLFSVCDQPLKCKSLIPNPHSKWSNTNLIYFTNDPNSLCGCIPLTDALNSFLLQRNESFTGAAAAVVRLQSLIQGTL